MSETHATAEAHHEPELYEIRIKGHLDSRWADWLGGLTITLQEDGVTLLTGPALDQAALHAVLRKVRDVGMPLLSVNRIEPGPSTTLGTGQADASDVRAQNESMWSKKGDE